MCAHAQMHAQHSMRMKAIDDPTLARTGHGVSPSHYLIVNIVRRDRRPLIICSFAIPLSDRIAAYLAAARNYGSLLP